jgi:hypothetical protein
MLEKKSATVKDVSTLRTASPIPGGKSDGESPVVVNLREKRAARSPMRIRPGEVMVHPAVAMVKEEEAPEPAGGAGGMRHALMRRASAASMAEMVEAKRRSIDTQAILASQKEKVSKKSVR